MAKHMNLNEPLWIGSSLDVRTGEAAEEALQRINDSAYADDNGITKVSEERWKAAQVFEHNTWLKCALGAASDRNDEHAHHFNQYRMLPHQLGNVLEVGCGPFTQIGTILGKGHVAEFVMLLDPLLNEYLQHPNCSYKSKQLGGVPTGFVACQMEEFCQLDYFNTAVCINVLEHVQDAVTGMRKLTMSLSSGGLLIFNDRTWDKADPKKLYDIGHPIRLKTPALEAMLAGYEQVYRNEFDFELGKNVYFVGRKK